MSKDEILDYVMNSPENTNKAVLSSMLDSIGGGSGGGAHIFRPLTQVGQPKVLDKTFAEIKAMLEAGVVMYEGVGQYYYPLRELSYNDNDAYYAITFGNGTYYYRGSSPDDYPTEDLD